MRNRGAQSGAEAAGGVHRIADEIRQVARGSSLAASDDPVLREHGGEEVAGVAILELGIGEFGEDRRLAELVDQVRAMLARAAEVEHHRDGLPPAFRRVKQIGQLVDRAAMRLVAVRLRIYRRPPKPPRRQVEAIHFHLQIRRDLADLQPSRVAVAGTDVLGVDLARGTVLLDTVLRRRRQHGHGG